jgi:hypothetical protein
MRFRLILTHRPDDEGGRVTRKVEGSPKCISVSTRLHVPKFLKTVIFFPIPSVLQNAEAQDTNNCNSPVVTWAWNMVYFEGRTYRKLKFRRRSWTRRERGCSSVMTLHDTGHLILFKMLISRELQWLSIDTWNKYVYMACMTRKPLEKRPIGR